MYVEHTRPPPLMILEKERAVIERVDKIGKSLGKVCDFFGRA